MTPFLTDAGQADSLLFVCEVCFAFFNESSHAFLLVFRSKAEAEYFVFIGDTGNNVAVDAAVDSCFSKLYGDFSVGSDLLSRLFSFVHELFLRNDFVYEADAVCFLSVDHLSREDQFFAVAAANDTGKALRAAETGSNAEADFGLAEFSVVGSIAEIASAGEFAAAAESVAVYSGDNRLGKISIRVNVS